MSSTGRELDAHVSGAHLNSKLASGPGNTVINKRDERQRTNAFPPTPCIHEYICAPHEMNNTI